MESYASEYRRRRDDPSVDNLDYESENEEYYQQSDIENQNIEEEDVRNAFSQWMNIEHHEKIAKDPNPYHLDMYRIKMSKPPPSPDSAAKASDSKREKANSRLKRLRLLEDRLQHIEQMKQALQHEIREMLRNRDRDQQIRPALKYKAKAKEREWNIDRFKPGTYRPLVRFRDEPNLL